MPLPPSIAKDIKSKLYTGLDKFWHTNFLRTGIPPVDWSLGGGFGYGRLAEVFGNYSAGKTMLLYKALASNQKMKSKTGKPGVSILFEEEGAYDEDFFSAMDGDPSTLIVVQAGTVERIFDDIKQLCDNIVKAKDDTPYAVGWDSIAETGTNHLFTEGIGGTRDMTKSNLMSQGCKLISNKAKQANVCIIATNQVTELIGSKDSASHTPGGNAYKFAVSQRVELKFDGGSATSIIWDESETKKIGRWTRGEVVKNKLAAPFGRFSLPIYLYPGLEHPLFNEHKTKLGIDIIEALFGFYKNNVIHGIQVIEVPTQGWFNLNQKFGGEKFRKASWPAILKGHPELYEFCYGSSIGAPAENILPNGEVISNGEKEEE